MKFLYHLFLFVFCVDGDSDGFAEMDSKKLRIKYTPYVVVIRLNEIDICNGVIVEKSWVLTSSYCIGEDGDYSVKYGMTGFYNNQTSSVMTKKILKIGDKDDDRLKELVVLLKVDTEFIFGDNVRNILLPPSGKFLPSNIGTVVFHVNGILYSYNLNIGIEHVNNSLLNLGEVDVKYGSLLQGSPFIFNDTLYAMLIITKKIERTYSELQIVHNSHDLFAYLVNIPHLIKWMEQIVPNLKKKVDIFPMNFTN